MRRAAIVLLMVLAVASLGTGKAPDIPEVIASPHPDAEVPLWVSERAAFGSDGSLRAGMVPRSQITRYRTQLQEKRYLASHGEGKDPGKDCVTYFGRMPAEETSDRSAISLVNGAKAIFSARIVAMEQGFFSGGTPGSLLRLNVTQVLRGSSDIDTTGDVFLFYPQARIAIPEGLLCAMPVGTKLKPAIGDIVMLFPSRGAWEKTRRVIEVDPRNIVLQRPDGTMGQVPAGFVEAGAATMMDIGDWVRRLTAEPRDRVQP